MKLLLAGEDRPGALLRSLEPGLRQLWDVTVIDPANAVTRLIDQPSIAARTRRRARARRTAPCFHEAVEQLQPDVTLVIKGSGLTGHDISRESPVNGQRERTIEFKLRHTTRR